MIKTDFLIIGAGIIGLTIAREIRKRHPNASIHICEKEDGPAFHASGRNSGVLHAGFYYTADSLKARFTLLGNQMMTEYCLERDLPIKKIGKLVVAKDANDLSQIDELLQRAHVNHVPLELIDEKAAKEIEPRVKTYQRALWSPKTSTVDPTLISETLVKELINAGVVFLFGKGYLSKHKNGVTLQGGELVQAGHVVNAAGLYADKIARDFSYALDYRILPFKGLYLYSNEPLFSLRTNIYPVPDLRNPFLGVHFTVTVEGKTKIGPTAIPALWREQYDSFSRFKLGEATDILLRQAKLFGSAGFDFRSLALDEVKKMSKKRLVQLASHLLEGVKIEDYQKWGKPGIRAQLINIKTSKLEMDFKVFGDSASTHVVNAVSPAFTCSMAFAEHICNHMDQDHPKGRM